MANIMVTSKCTIYDGMSITFKAPCDCSAIQGLTVKDHSTTKTFTFRDTHGNTLTGVENLFSQGAYIKVVLDTTNNYAYIQNGDSNGYLEEKLNAILTDETKALYGMDSSAVPDDVFAVIPEKIHNDNSNLHGQWMEKRVGPGISIKTGELVNLVDDVATKKAFVEPFANGVEIDTNTGTNTRFLCPLDENHVFGVYGSSLDTWVLEVNENGGISQLNTGWINASYSYAIEGAVRLNKNYMFVLQTSGATHYASLIRVSDDYQCSLAARPSFSNSSYSSATLKAIAAASETEVYIIYTLSAGRPVTKYNLVKFTISPENSTITRGNVYDFSAIVPEGQYLYHDFKIYGVGDSRCLIAMNKSTSSSYTSDSYNDQTLLLFDMSGSTPVLLQSEDVFSSSTDAYYPIVATSTAQISEKEICGIYAPTQNTDGTYNYKVFKCVVGVDEFTVSQKESVTVAEKIKFGHYIKEKKLMMPFIEKRSDYDRYPICYFDDETLELYVYKTDLAKIYTGTLEETNANKWNVETVWMPNNKLLRVYFQKNSSYDAEAQIMEVNLSASEYLAVSDANAGEMVKLGINGNFNIPSAIAGDSYALAERVRANAYMNGIMSFLPEPYEMASGSYVGTGNYTYTNNNYIYDPVVLNFDFVPKAVLITMTYTEATNKYPIYAMVTPYGGICFESHSYAEFIHYFIGASVSGTSITIDFPRGYTILQQSTSSFSNRQNPLNAKNCVYHYTAWGSKE